MSTPATPCFKHGDMIRVHTFHQNVDGTIFELQGCLASWGYDEAKRAEQTERSKANGHEQVGGCLRSVVLLGDREAARAENARWDAAPRVAEGDVIEVAGQLYRLHLKRPANRSQPSDFLRLEPVS